MGRSDGRRRKTCFANTFLSKIRFDDSRLEAAPIIKKEEARVVLIRSRAPRLGRGCCCPPRRLTVALHLLRAPRLSSKARKGLATAFFFFPEADGVCVCMYLCVSIKLWAGRRCYSAFSSSLSRLLWDSLKSRAFAARRVNELGADTGLATAQVPG